MVRLRQFLGFWYDFVVGDDWRVALTVAFALAATATVNHLTGAGVWWIVVVAVLAVLPMSIHRVTRDRRRNHSATD